jgi:hypothetical protein
MEAAEKDQAVRSRPWAEQNGHSRVTEKDVVDQNVSTWAIVGSVRSDQGEEQHVLV